LLLAAIVAGFPSVAWSQFDAVPETSVEKGAGLGEAKTEKYQVGVIIRAVGGPCRGLLCTIPVPIDWPEQQVQIVDEDISLGVAKVYYRTLEMVLVQQMVIEVP